MRTSADRFAALARRRVLTQLGQVQRTSPTASDAAAADVVRFSVELKKEDADKEPRSGGPVLWGTQHDNLPVGQERAKRGGRARRD